MILNACIVKYSDHSSWIAKTLRDGLWQCCTFRENRLRTSLVKLHSTIWFVISSRLECELDVLTQSDSKNVRIPKIPQGLQQSTIEEELIFNQLSNCCFGQIKKTIYTSKDSCLPMVNVVMTYLDHAVHAAPLDCFQFPNFCHIIMISWYYLDNVQWLTIFIAAGNPGGNFLSLAKHLSLQHANFALRRRMPRG